MMTWGGGGMRSSVLFFFARILPPGSRSSTFLISFRAGNSERGYSWQFRLEATTRCTRWPPEREKNLLAAAWATNSVESKFENRRRSLLWWICRARARILIDFPGHLRLAFDYEELHYAIGRSQPWHCLNKRNVAISIVDVIVMVMVFASLLHRSCFSFRYFFSFSAVFFGYAARFCFALPQRILVRVYVLFSILHFCGRLYPVWEIEQWSFCENYPMLRILYAGVGEDGSL